MQIPPAPVPEEPSGESAHLRSVVDIVVRMEPVSADVLRATRAGDALQPLARTFFRPGYLHHLSLYPPWELFCFVLFI